MNIGWKLGFFGRRKVRKLVRKGHVVDALKYVRAKTGAGLKEVKTYVDRKFRSRYE